MKRLPVFLLLLSALRLDAQSTRPTLRTVNPDSVAHWVRRVESSPDSIQYHTAYLRSIGWESALFWQAERYKSKFDSTEAAIRSQYETWSRRFPNSATVAHAIGTAYYECESPKATAYLKRTVELDPRNAEAYLQLAIDAERWGNRNDAKEYMRLASVADTKNPAYSFYYAMYFDEEDMNVFQTLIYQLADRFPAHERGAQGLYWLGYNIRDNAGKINVWEDLRKRYDPQAFSWSAGGMSLLYQAYLDADRYADAAALAKAMSVKPGWDDRIDLAHRLSEADRLLKAGSHREAYQAITGIKKTRNTEAATKVPILEARLADLSGHTDSAYAKLLRLQAKAPTDARQTAIEAYAAKLGKAAGQVQFDLKAIRAVTTKPAFPFDLHTYSRSAKGRLADYKGKPVLLTFWFPGCGPCRAEFPHFENVVKKFRKSELAYVGINVLPIQDDYVLPFMKGTGYSFIPLRATNDWAQEKYGVRGQPTNFLIDKEGNIVFANFRTTAENERTLELMIRSLL
ncbi:MAG: TlpA family protein disulfide reductase [Bacteroidetes bacterium]|nr:TlpA family protein disulfide reductase [Bacteroidota bacterium]